ncbi:MAG: hypothetical protein HOC95_00675, partial [Candidatus Diapherotrites archaeon]|nr:hypothetical protein [Candidatus Diapherotrites archaeon]
QIRFYFLPGTIGPNTINFKSVGNGIIENAVSFNTVKEKELIVELNNSTVQLGRNFNVKVLDEGLRGIENALIKFVDSTGQVKKSVSGDGREGSGRNGNYRIENNLDTGVYIVTVNVDRYKSNDTPMLVTTSSVLSVTPTLETKMLFEETTKIVTMDITNNSEFAIRNLSAESDNSENFRVQVFAPAIMNSGQTQKVQVKVDFIGEEDNADETINIFVKGMVEGSFFVQESSSLHAVYNRELDNDCLELRPGNVTINLIGRQNANDTETIEAINNCEIAINLEQRTVENTRRSYILVKSEDITLQPGQTKNIVITATNLIERQYYQNNSFSYDIVYDSNYLTKRLDVTVKLINPTMSLSYPGQVTLFLAKDKPTGAATAAQPIFITNSSQFPIEGLRFSVEKDYATQSNVRISVEPSGVVSLGAGESISPPKLIFAEASSKLTGPAKARIYIEGSLANLNNRVGSNDRYDYQALFASSYASTTRQNYSNSSNQNRYTNNYSNQGTLGYYDQSSGYANSRDLLGVIEATVYYSGFDCLKVSVVGDNTFNLSAEGAQRSSKISIQNTCAEPVRVLEASSRSPDLMFGLPTITVAPGENAHTYLSVLSLKNNVKLENYPVIIRGVTGMSQSPIEAKALQINIYAGVNFNDTYSKATKGVKAKTCSDEDVTISIPKTSSGNSDCSNGYCDAAQASAYLAKKLDLTIKKARSQALVAQKETDASACGSQQYCTFGSLQVPKEVVKIYLKNDAITAETMQDAFDKISSGSSGFVGGIDQGDYRFEERVINEQTMEIISMSPYGRAVFIDDQLKGCGYYEVILNGSFPVNAQGVAFDLPTITMQARASSGGPRVATKECSDSLENLVNFIPVDKDYTLGDDKGSWLTSIETEKKLEGIAKGLSTKLFNNEDRVGQGNGNKIVLAEGAASNALAEVCLAGGTKKTINVTVTSQIDSMNATTRKAFETQVVKMVAETAKGNFGNNCLVKGSKGYNCVRLTDSSGIGGLKLVVPNKQITLSHREGCVKAELTSNLNEQINFEVNPEEGRKKFNGVTSIAVFDEDKKTKFYEKDFVSGTTTTDETITLVKGNGTTFEKQIMVCAYPGNTKKKASEHAENAYITANGAQFILTAVNKNAGLGEGTDKADGTITISTGRLHPDDLIHYLGKKPEVFKNKIGNDNPYYFTLIWNDSSDTIYDFGDYYVTFRELGHGEDHVFRETDGSLTDTGVVTKKKATAARAGMMSYFKWCAGTSAVCNVGTGLPNMALGVVFDCGLPAATVMRNDLAKAFPLWKSVMDELAKIPLVGK